MTAWIHALSVDQLLPDPRSRTMMRATLRQAGLAVIEHPRAPQPGGAWLFPMAAAVVVTPGLPEDREVALLEQILSRWQGSRHLRRAVSPQGGTPIPSALGAHAERLLYRQAGPGLN